MSRPPESPRSRRRVELGIEPASYPSPEYVVRYPSQPTYRYAEPRRSRDERLAEPSSQIPLQPLPWFDRMLIAFGVLELILMVIGFWHAGTTG